MEVPVRPGPGIDPGELRGWAARKSLAEDARRAMDTILSGNKVPELAPYVGLLLGHHFVRIAYEGAIAIRSANPCVGIPELAASSTFAQVTERARQLTKMLDNTKKTYADVLSEFVVEYKIHHDALTGNAIRLARWLKTDLGLFYVDGALVGYVPTGAAPDAPLLHATTHSVRRADTQSVGAAPPSVRRPRPVLP